MKREVFTDLYRWLRGSELALHHFSCDSGSELTSDVSSRLSSGCLTMYLFDLDVRCSLS